MASRRSRVFIMASRRSRVFIMASRRSRVFTIPSRRSRVFMMPSRRSRARRPAWLASHVVSSVRLLVARITSCTTGRPSLHGRRAGLNWSAGRSRPLLSAAACWSPIRRTRRGISSNHRRRSSILVRPPRPDPRPYGSVHLASRSRPSAPRRSPSDRHPRPKRDRSRYSSPGRWRSRSLRPRVSCWAPRPLCC
jgi:hypothetical protein